MVGSALPVHQRLAARCRTVSAPVLIGFAVGAASQGDPRRLASPSAAARTTARRSASQRARSLLALQQRQDGVAYALGRQAAQARMLDGADAVEARRARYRVGQ